ncbi:hypothetical protein [Paenibacillus sedimenti]|uniref:Uncharacterized protein n=1 Tax=Paenibacillus sedimenti TaxID=2770274 RepID=A0A926KR30_9BACL|nr:hypothetical protein [Paenibacillus sedimenti]MBD0382395.1 hypothetical protein [Paenibacillus sedimenti]
MITQISGFVILIVVWSFIKIRSLLVKQQTKEAAVYGGLMGVSAVIGSLLMAGVDLPSLVVPYEIIFQPIGKMILGQ